MTARRVPLGSRVPGARYAALDGLRGFAILMVLFVHFIGDATPHTAVERALVKLANYGIWGVDLFFVLSGFLITGILHDAKSSPHYFRDFYVRRTLRIFPLYYSALALLFGVLPVLPVAYPAGLAESARHQAWLWCYVTNVYLARAGAWALPYVSHFWSLAVEEHFYLLWPIVVLTSTRAALLRICVAVSAARCPSRARVTSRSSRSRPAASTPSAWARSWPSPCARSGSSASRAPAGPGSWRSRRWCCSRPRGMPCRDR
jgi:peptidoglycan/LPS O-acetylase OafA/YrhL